MRVRAAECGLSVETEHAASLPARIETDPDRLEKILLNLVGNAGKFTESGHVRIVCSIEGSPEEQPIRFSVRDTGIGMDVEELGRVFEAFSQADASVTRRFGGTGLGLSICNGLAILLDGELIATSEPIVGPRARPGLPRHRGAHRPDPHGNADASDGRVHGDRRAPEAWLSNPGDRTDRPRDGRRSPAVSGRGLRRLHLQAGRLRRARLEVRSLERSWRPAKIGLGAAAPRPSVIRPPAARPCGDAW